MCLNFSSNDSDQSERLLRRYLATRQDINNEHREKLVEYYMFTFSPDFSEKAQAALFEKLAANDDLFSTIATEALKSFVQWLFKNHSKK